MKEELTIRPAGVVARLGPRLHRGRGNHIVKFLPGGLELRSEMGASGLYVGCHSYPIGTPSNAMAIGHGLGTSSWSGTHARRNAVKGDLTISAKTAARRNTNLCRIPTRTPQRSPRVRSQPQRNASLEASLITAADGVIEIGWKRRDPNVPAPFVQADG